MTRPRHIAVIDVGKTNAKLALVDLDALEEVAVVTRPNAVRPGPPWPHFDLEGHWAFFLRHLARFQESHGIDGISVTTHGAAAVLLQADGTLAAPMLDYEHDGPDALHAEYDALRPPFEETGAPRLPGGLNLGAQLHWLFATDPGLRARTAHIVTYPQYWGFRLTGKYATDVTSLGCHTDLWAPRDGRLSALADRLGIDGLLAPAHHSSDVLGVITPAVADLTGLPRETPVLCGIHDSNASLLPHLMGRTGPFTVVSSGTWVVAMAIGGEAGVLDSARDTLINTSAFGDPVPSARFMGGREFELIRDGAEVTPTPEDRARVLCDSVMLLPSVVPESGPFPGRAARWTAEPASDGERLFALALYLALMTDTCLSLIGARGPTVVEGPFARNADFLAMLCACRGEVETADSATGTSIGAAQLFGAGGAAPATAPVTTAAEPGMRGYADSWRALCQV
ncbi:Sugar (pentulose or hexulose) kinase [Poseidonocella pacifica]|uniref:Sugar (Pentulose or hexulose) kinase n=1 Tax=Poseidonocella pacifica TaxID=871651 RepID=A0A1I0Y1J1_9RHOB|nr:FGGY-family carbohydrate kinase [Poseidonocella pacifica]SFB07082.1 Sugar (pentulose or hexulose) kinase [Poseidonocella pacifica]